MAIITISRGTFSGGKALAECLSRTLGYRSIDRDMLIATPIASVGLSVFAFAAQRDRTYVVITLVVLAVLICSLAGLVSPPP